MARARVSPTQPFAARVVRWQAAHGRHGLPWQGTRDAYRLWLSEVMLQQTQVSTVIPYYARFVERFPTVEALAAAAEDEVLALWSGLGYYARARNLHRAAREVVERCAGRFPRTFEALCSLPGVGRSTAAAIAAFASGERQPILDGNVRRVLARHAGIGGDPSGAAVLARLWDEAQARLPATSIEAYTQGMMDLGADVCRIRNPACLACPVSDDCVALREGRVAELPGKRSRAPRARRRIAMLVVLSGDAVLLEKRPAAGLWGGLWSLPEAPPELPPAQSLAARWGLCADEAEPLPPFEHAFTHFTLDVDPWRLRLAGAPRRELALPAAWVPRVRLGDTALPAPVRRLLDRYA